MMRTSPIGAVIIELSEIDSTNNYAMRLINEGMAEHGMAIRADYQTNGKGQLGNVWQAEESKNLLCSVIVDTSEFAIEKQFYLNAATCIALAETLMKNYNLKDVHIKWPNDIYAGNKKIAGILIENQIRGTLWTHSVVGIGLNINQIKFDDLNRATSILLETNKIQKVHQVLKHVLKEMQTAFQKMNKKEDELFQTFNDNLLNVGQQITFKRNYEIHSGKLLGVNPQGCVELEVNGILKSFKHKEIELIVS
jgi:BirA family transcriptional regulator, biotin operon repressor / biotin---[acetyl-CoA-carboxylase] ligase